jgi:hypothetical protein
MLCKKIKSDKLSDLKSFKEAFILTTQYHTLESEYIIKNFQQYRNIVLKNFHNCLINIENECFSNDLENLILNIGIFEFLLRIENSICFEGICNLLGITKKNIGENFQEKLLINIIENGVVKFFKTTPLVVIDLILLKTINKLSDNIEINEVCNEIFLCGLECFLYIMSIESLINICNELSINSNKVKEDLIENLINFINEDCTENNLNEEKKNRKRKMLFCNDDSLVNKKIKLF